MSSVSVVIPTLGRRPVLRTCLERLAVQDERDFEVLVVADAAADPGAVEALAAVGAVPGLRVLQALRPGASCARNTGWRAAAAPVVLFLDDDVLAGPELVRAHRAVHDERRGTDVGVLGPMRWRRGLRITPFMRFIEDGFQFDYEALRERDETGWWHLYTCNVSLKRAALERVGGLDETGFPFGYEDLDLGRRIHDAIGLTLVFSREAAAEHDHAMSLEQWRGRIKRIAWSERRFVSRFPDVAPHFHDALASARAEPPMRGRTARLAGRVPHATPGLGPYLQHQADRWFAQQLAGPFFEAWAAAEAQADPGPPPGPGPGPGPEAS